MTNDDNAYRGHERDTPSGHMPDEFDRQLWQLTGLPDGLHTGDTPVRTINGLESAQWTIRTARLQDRDEDGKPEPARFVVFLEMHSRTQNVRLVLPADVTDVIDRHRSALTQRAVKRAARQGAATRKARGFTPKPPPRRKRKK